MWTVVALAAHNGHTGITECLRTGNTNSAEMHTANS